MHLKIISIYILLFWTWFTISLNIYIVLKFAYLYFMFVCISVLFLFCFIFINICILVCVLKDFCRFFFFLNLLFCKPVKNSFYQHILLFKKQIFCQHFQFLYVLAYLCSFILQILPTKRNFTQRHINFIPIFRQN